MRKEINRRITLCINFETLTTRVTRERWLSNEDRTGQNQGRKDIERPRSFRKRSSSKGGTGNRARPTPGSITGKYTRGWREACADGMLNFTVIDRHLADRSIATCSIVCLTCHRTSLVTRNRIVNYYSASRRDRLLSTNDTNCARIMKRDWNTCLREAEREKG